MQRLVEKAEAMGLRVAYRDLGRRSGQLHSSGLVYINQRRSLPAQRIVLAHEMGHWHHGHDWSQAHDHDLDERQADQYAARLLVSRSEYAAAEAVCGAHPGALARELGVTRTLIELRREDFARDTQILATVEAWRSDAWAG
jgi:Zn-dependent peptidase ImmA (M78 family)